MRGPDKKPRTRKRIPLAERFWPKVEKRGDDECWPWVAALNGKGYGQIGRGGGGAGVAKAHVVAWELKNGPRPAGFDVCHLCDNRECCNPNHLFIGTRAENLADMVRKNRSAWGEKSAASKLTKGDIPVIRSRLDAGESQRKIAGDFGVSQKSISNIYRRQTWVRVEC